MKRPTWRTADSREIPIKELGDKHLVNLLRLIETRLGLNPHGASDENAGQPATPGPLTETMLHQAFLNGGRLPHGGALPDHGQITKVDQNSDGRVEYTVEFRPERYRFAGTIRTTSGGHSLRRISPSRPLGDDRLKPYDALVLEAVHRGLFDWSPDRKYLTSISNKITARIAENDAP